MQNYSSFTHYVMFHAILYLFPLNIILMQTKSKTQSGAKKLRFLQFRFTLVQK